MVLHLYAVVVLELSTPPCCDSVVACPPVPATDINRLKIAEAFKSPNTIVWAAPSSLLSALIMSNNLIKPTEGNDHLLNRSRLSQLPIRISALVFWVFTLFRSSRIFQGLNVELNRWIGVGYAWDYRS